MRIRRVTVTILSVLFGCIVFGLIIWLWSGVRTGARFGSILIYEAIVVACIGGLMTCGASSGRSIPHPAQPMHDVHNFDYDLEKLNVKSRRDGVAAGLIVFLAGIPPGLLGYTFCRLFEQATN